MATETAAGRRAAAQDRVAHRLRRGLAGSGAGFAGCALAALGSLGLPWLHDARHGASGWALLGAWDVLRPERWPASRFALGGYLLLLVAGWAGLRRGLAWAALVALGSSLAAALPLLALAAAVGGFDGWAPTWDTGLLLFLLASAGMALAAGAACTLHLLAAVILGADRRPRGW